MNNVIDTVIDRNDNPELFNPTLEQLPTWLRPSLWIDLDRQRFYKMLQSDVLAAWEYDQHQKHHELSAEQELWFAVLACAMEDFKTAWVKRNQNRRRLDEIHHYFFGQDDGEGSFEFCCDSIKANKINILKQLIKFAKEHTN